MYETRKRIIFDLLRRQGSATVSELKQLLSVSDMTVRRDVQSMAEEGLLKRVHGGAVSMRTGSEEEPFAARQVEELARKQSIARFAATFLKGGESLYIDGSTTCSELARLIAAGGSHLVVTDSLCVLLELINKKSIELLLLGGALDRDGNTFDGLLAVENARKVMVDCCFFSAKGFSADQITNATMIGSQVKKIMIQSAQRCFLLADSTKFGKIGVIKLCEWRDVDVLITDCGLAETALEPIRAHGTQVHLAELREGAA